MSEPYTFSSVDGGKTFSRKLYGFEALCCSYAAEADGLFFYTGSVILQLPSSLKISKLKSSIESSWIRLRHVGPIVGCTTSFSTPTRDWVYKYEVPQSETDVQDWAKATIIWHENEKSLVDRDAELAENYWDPSNGTPALVLHVGPVSHGSGKWTLSIQGPHGVVDGRGCLSLFDQLLTSLNQSLTEGENVTDIGLDWGEETERLCGAGSVLTGEFDALASNEAVPAAVPPPGFIPYLPPFVVNTSASKTNIARLVTLNAAQTAKLRGLSKLHGRTITEVCNSIVALADVESAVRSAKLHGDEHLKSAIGAYEQATHWLIALTFKDQRPSLPSHSEFLGPKGTPLFAVDGYDLAVDMQTIRRALRLNKDALIADRDASDAVFWNGVVKSYVEAHQRQKGDHASYIAREVAKQSTTKSTISTAQMCVRVGVASSVGHIEALGELSDFVPNVAANAHRKVIVEGVMHRVRPGLPLMMVVYWQYDGKLSFCIHTAEKYQTDAEMDIMAEAFQGWLEAAIGNAT